MSRRSAWLLVFTLVDDRPSKHPGFTCSLFDSCGPSCTLGDQIVTAVANLPKSYSLILETAHYLVNSVVLGGLSRAISPEANSFELTVPVPIPADVMVRFVSVLNGRKEEFLDSERIHIQNLLRALDSPETVPGLSGSTPPGYAPPAMGKTSPSPAQDEFSHAAVERFGLPSQPPG